MSVVDDLDRLVELRERGDLSPAEYNEAKQQLIGVSGQAVGAAHGAAAAPDGAYLLYRLIASWLRRAAVAMAVVALLFGLFAGWSGLRYLDLSTHAEAIKDAAIARGFGLKIPDPRPTIERAGLEARAAAYAGLAAVTGLIALGSLVGALLLRPPRQSREAQGAEPLSQGAPGGVLQAQRGG